jgi:hypothetical protein
MGAIITGDIERVGDGAYEVLPAFILVDEGEDLGADLKDEPPDRPPDLAAKDSDGLASSAAPHTIAVIDLASDGDKTFFQSTACLFISSLLLFFITMEFTICALVASELLAVNPLTEATMAKLTRSAF